MPKLVACTDAYPQRYHSKFVGIKRILMEKFVRNLFRVSGLGWRGLSRNGETKSY